MMRKLLAAAIVACTMVGFAPLAARVATHAPARVADDLAAALDDAAGGDLLTVFVHGRTGAAARDAIEAAGLQQVGEFESIDVPVAVGTAAQIQDLATRSGVTYVEPNREIELLLETSRKAIRADEAITATFSGAGPFDGSGRTIAVVDGGVDGTHPMFTAEDGTSKVVRNLKVACTTEFLLTDTCPDGEDGDGDDADGFFVDTTGSVNDSDTMSIGGHGTHVAGIAAGYPVTTARGHELSGVAPGAKIVSISVAQGIGIYAANAALDWIVRHHDDPCELETPDPVACPPITVVNNSYGARGDWDPNSATSKIQKLLVAEGIVMVWANGNGDLTGDGGDGSRNLSGTDAQHPAPGVISVANYDDNDSGTRDGSLAPSSSRGDATRPETWPDVSAPGTAITSACRPYLPICSADADDPDYGTISGTSMAAPHVAGAVAVLQQANPSLSAGDVEVLLENTAYRFLFGAPYWTHADAGNRTSPTSFDKGHGLIDLTAALAGAVGAKAPSAAAAPCAAPLVIDDADDATDVHVITGTPLPSEPQLDIRSADLRWDGAAGTLTLTATATDIQPMNPPGTAGILYELVFGHAGEEYFVRATRELDGQQHATFGQFAVPTPRTIASDLEAVFDVEAETVTVKLPNTVLATGEVPQFADGQQLTGFSVVTRRQMGAPKNDVTPALGLPRAIVLQADSATSSCPFTLGRPAPEPKPKTFQTSEERGGGKPTAVDGSIKEGESFAAEGKTPTDTSALPMLEDGPCGGPDAEACVTYRVEAVPRKPSTLNVWLQPTLESIALDDFDLHVYDADGELLASSAGPQTVLEINGIFLDVEEQAVFTIVVDPFNVPKDVEFVLHADLYAD